MRIEQQYSDQALFNRLLIEESARLRAAKQELTDNVFEAVEQRDKLQVEVDRLIGVLQLNGAELDSMQAELATRHKLMASVNNSLAAHKFDGQTGPVGVEYALTELKRQRDQAHADRQRLIDENDQLKGVLVERNAELDAAKEYAGFWGKEAFRLAERAGWVAYGSHVEPNAELEFDGSDEAQMPLWERPVKVKTEPKPRTFRRVHADGKRGSLYRYQDGVLQVYTRRCGAWIKSGYESLDAITAKSGNTFVEEVEK